MKSSVFILFFGLGPIWSCGSNESASSITNGNENGTEKEELLASSFEEDAGLGLWSPDFELPEPIRFYATAASKDADEVNVIHNPETGLALDHEPTWLNPLHLKLDYNLFFFRAIDSENGRTQVVVNEETGLTRWVETDRGWLRPWEEILLEVFAVEPAEDVPGFWSVGNTEFAPEYTLRPMSIRGDTIEVRVLDFEGNEISRESFPWRRGKKLMVKYWFLS